MTSHCSLEQRLVEDKVDDGGGNDAQIDEQRCYVHNDVPDHQSPAAQRPKRVDMAARGIAHLSLAGMSL
jgi:hypothetical protein